MFRKLIDLLPRKPQGVPWEAPEIAIALIARIGSIPSFLIEIPASFLKIYYYLGKSSKPKLTGDQIYQLEMKKRDEFARRQKAMEDVLNSKYKDEPSIRVQKMDKLIVAYCAPYYKDSPAFSKVMVLWRDITANFNDIKDRKEISRILVDYYIDFVANMIYALSWLDKDIPKNYVFVHYNNPPWNSEPPRYDYEM